MSQSNVLNTETLQSLYVELPRYCEKNVNIMQGFSSILSQKIEHLESLDSHFQNCIQQAEANVNSCEAALNACEWSAASADAMGMCVDCSGQRAALSTANAELSRRINNYAQYKTEMSRLTDAFSSYKSAESRYHNSSNTVQTQTTAELNRIILNLDTYTAVFSPIDAGANTSGFVASAGLPGAVGGMYYTETLLDRLRSGKEKIKVKAVPISNGCGSESFRGSFTGARIANNVESAFTNHSVKQMEDACDTHDMDYYYGVPVESANNKLQDGAFISGSVVKMANSEKSWNEAQFDRKLTNELLPFYEGDLAHDQKLVPEDSKIGEQLLKMLKQEEKEKANQVLNELLTDTKNPNMSPVN